VFSEDLPKSLKTQITKYLENKIDNTGVYPCGGVKPIAA
jgi:hypothetical protein